MSPNPESDPIDLSVVIPVHNEAEALPELVNRLRSVLPGAAERWEIILVDDGSTDGSARLLRRMAYVEPRLHPFATRIRQGQTHALRAGLARARGRIVVTLDGDLQNPPEEIPKLVAALDDTVDVVVGWRRDRHDPFLVRRFPSEIANRWIRRLTRVPVHDHGCALRAYRADVIRDLHLYGDHHRLLPAVCFLHGARIREIPVAHAPRRTGRSKYGVRRVFRVLADVLAIYMLLRYRRHPSIWFLYLALPMAFFASMALLMYGLTTVQTPESPAVVWLGAAFILGVCSLSLGAMAVFSEFMLRMEPSALRPRILGGVAS